MKYVVLQKAEVKPYTRTRKGKMERVAGYQALREQQQRVDATLKEPSRMAVASEADVGGAKDVAMTILQQMGGVGRIQATTGAKNFAYFDEKGKKGISFDFPSRGKKPNFVKVVLDDDDTYSVEFGKKKPISWKRLEREKEGMAEPKIEDFYTKLGEHKGVYWDQLKDVFERNTGLFLSLHKSCVILDKADVKGFTRIRRGKAEQVHPFFRAHKSPVEWIKQLSPKAKESIRQATHHFHPSGELKETRIVYRTPWGDIPESQVK